MITRKRILYKYCYKLHLYIGVVLGLIISLICITGSLIVYKPELEKLAIKELATIEPNDTKLPLQTLLDNVLQSYPNFKVDNLVLYGGETNAYSLRGTLPDHKGRVQIYVNQYTGDVLGADFYNSKLMQWLYDFHVNLFMGKTGVKIVAILGFCLLFIALTGLIILPRSNLFRWQRNSSLRVKNYRIHLLVGLFSFAFIVLICFTGSYYGFKKEYQLLSQTIFSGQALAPSPAIEKYTGPYAPLDTILSRATHAFQAGTPTMIFFPKGNDKTFSVRLKTCNDYERTGSNHVYIHPITGSVIKTNLWEDKPTAEKVIRSMYFLHFGTFAGHWSRILWMIFGLTIPLLYYTGLYIWIKKVIRRKFD